MLDISERKMLDTLSSGMDDLSMISYRFHRTRFYAVVKLTVKVKVWTRVANISSSSASALYNAVPEW